MYCHIVCRSPVRCISTVAAKLTESESLQLAACGRRFAELFTRCDVNITEKVCSATGAGIGTTDRGYTPTCISQYIPVNFHYTKLTELSDVPISDVCTAFVFVLFGGMKWKIMDVLLHVVAWRWECDVCRYETRQLYNEIQRSRVRSRRYQIFWVVVGLERGPLSLVRSIEELLEWKM